MTRLAPPKQWVITPISKMEPDAETLNDQDGHPLLGNNAENQTVCVQVKKIIPGMHVFTTSNEPDEAP